MSNRCEDYPCCGHGPLPMGDGGGCPDEVGPYAAAPDLLEALRATVGKDGHYHECLAGTRGRAPSQDERSTCSTICQVVVAAIAKATGGQR